MFESPSMRYSRDVAICVAKQFGPYFIQPKIAEILHGACPEQVFETQVQASYTDARNLRDLISANRLMDVGVDIVLGTADMSGQDGFALARAAT